jgi:hypothetical protein
MEDMMQHNHTIVTKQHELGYQQGNETKMILGYLNYLAPPTKYEEGVFSGILISELNQPETYLWLDQKEHSEIENLLTRVEFNRSSYTYFFCKVDMSYRVQSWRLIKSPLLLWQLNELFAHCYLPEDVLQLIAIGNKLGSQRFYEFFWQCLGDLEFIRAFVSIPASKSHHHAFPGGLLQHSIECVNIVESNLKLIFEMSQNEKEATLLAALFHDAGKVKTLSLDEHTQLGKIMDHEAFTLTALSEGLGQLQKSWCQGATVLQYLLTWTEKKGFCKFVGGNVLKMADHLSTSYSLYKQGFSKKPKHHFFAPIKVGSSVKYVNRLP